MEVVPPADAEDTVPCLMRAFWDYPDTRHLLPDERVRRRVLPRYLGADARGAARHGGLEAVRSEGAVVGAAAWVPPGAYPASWSRQIAEAWHLLPVAPWTLGALREARRGQGANREHHRNRAPHYWLRAIGVDPVQQGAGVGSQLVQSMLARADADARGVFLFTATAGNVGWYESFGFDVLASYHPTPRWPEVWAMWREPG